MSTLKIKRENGKIFCPLADSWHIETPEEKVRQEYIKILVENYGYSLDQMAQEIKVNNSQRGQGKARADIVIWKSKQDKIESKAAFIVVECKAENVRIREEDYYQGYNYASWAGASFFVTTNEKETKYFNVDKDYLPKELVEVVAIPTAEEALNDKKVKDILSKTKTFTRDDFTKILRTCHNIIRNNDKLSPEAAFDEISKILFMKIKYEREQRGAKVFTKNEFVEKEKWFEKEIRPSLKGTPKDLPYMQFLFYNTNELLKTFINRINPDHKSKIECNLEDLRNSIFYSALTDENGNILVDENGNKLLAEIGITDTEVFQNLTQAYMPKNEKIIKDIIIQIDDDITVEQLSEGEKKLILVKTVLEILSDEKTLVLMDEPDAHLHEGRKPALCNMMREYPNRQIVIATHSPIMAQIANEKELLMLELENGKSTILTDEKIEKIKKLSGTSWDVIGQGMMLRSSRPLVVFEGKTDVMYVKRALEMLKSRVTDYASLNVDFLNANGAGNVKSFIDNLKAFVPDSKKIVVFFDRDNAGKDGVQAITGISKNDGRVAHYQDIVQDNITTSFIPYKDGVTEGDFLIEDYFSWDDTIKAIVEDVIPDRKHPIKMLPNLPDKIKKELEKRINKFEADEFNGFIPLLDKIVELTKEQAV